jgi:hypothetical protein
MGWSLAVLVALVQVLVVSSQPNCRIPIRAAGEGASFSSDLSAAVEPESGNRQNVPGE